MESIVQLRQMMAERKFFEVQKLVEVQLMSGQEHRHDLLLLLHETLAAQGKNLANEQLLELAEFESQNNNHDFVLELINDFQSSRHSTIVASLKIRSAEHKGQMSLLHTLVSDFLIAQFENQRPVVPPFLQDVLTKYFKQDFNFRIKVLALELLTNDLEQAETRVKDLLISSVERSTSKGLKEKLRILAEILSPHSKNTTLSVYQNLCTLWANGISDKSDYKKIIEMILLFDDFRLQTLVLNLLNELSLNEEATMYASTLKSNKEYNFVYLDKFFPALKKFFIDKVKSAEQKEVPRISALDLTLKEKPLTEDISPIIDHDEDDEEMKLLRALKYEDFDSDQLCDIAVGFLQSEMPRAALKASDLARSFSKNDDTYLKASYLKLHSQLLLKDFRAAIDTSLDALSKAENKDDLLSFLYGQAEAYLRLGQKKNAKRILKRILSIDSSYRMTKERLEKL